MQLVRGEVQNRMSRNVFRRLLRCPWIQFLAMRMVMGGRH
jgi:hypothetical protein